MCVCVCVCGIADVRLHRSGQMPWDIVNSKNQRNVLCACNHLPHNSVQSSLYTFIRVNSSRCIHVQAGRACTWIHHDDMPCTYIYMYSWMYWVMYMSIHVHEYSIIHRLYNNNTICSIQYCTLLLYIMYNNNSHVECTIRMCCSMIVFCGRFVL